MSENYNEAFLNKYKELEYIKNTNPRAYMELEQQYNIITTFRNMRNVLSHSSDSCQVTESFYKELVMLVNRIVSQVDDVYLPLSKIKYIDIYDLLEKAVDIMKTNNYSFIPVLDDKGKVTKVISEGLVLALALEDNDLMFIKKSVDKFNNYFNLNNDPDYFYAFIGRKDKAIEAKEIFAKKNENKRCGLIFVTETGNPNEKLLGLITAWDVLDI